MTYAVFNIGASVYWLAPTAPPWYAAAEGRAGSAPVRRLMVEYGRDFWGTAGARSQCVRGNPLAAMPSLHFATSVMAALLLAEVGPVAGALGSRMRPRSVSRSSTSGSTTSWTFSREPRSRARCAGGGPARHRRSPRSPARSVHWRSWLTGRSDDHRERG